MRPLRFASIASVVALVVAMLAQGPVDARPSRPIAGGASITLSPDSGPPGTKLTITGSGFGPDEAVQVTWDHGPIGSLTHADPSGGFAFGTKVPAGATLGTHTFTATGLSTHRSAEAAFEVRADWPKFHFDHGNSGYNPYENVLSPSNVGTLEPAWTYGQDSTFFSAPAVADGVAYVVSDSHISAVNATTGHELWTKEMSGAGSSPAVSGGVVYAVSLSSTSLRAFDAMTGKLKWTYRIGGEPSLSSPVVARGIVYVGSGDGLTAIDARTGKLRWSYAVGGTDSSPAVADGTVFVGGAQAIYAIDAATGALRWSHPNDGIGSPAVVDGILYAASYDDSVYALDASTGKELWSFPAGEFVACDPAVANGLVYASSDDVLYAIDAGTGKLAWSRTVHGIGYSSPVVADGVVYVTPGPATPGKAYALNAATGAKLWNPDGRLFASSPVVVNGVVYLGSYDIFGGSQLSAFRLPYWTGGMRAGE